MPAIPASVWEAETHHKDIWRSAGKCVICGVKPRDLVCSWCNEPMCAACAKVHTEKAHRRERYIDALARKIDRLFSEVQFPPSAGYRLSVHSQTSATIEEFDEAAAIVAEWREDAKPLAKAVEA